MRDAFYLIDAALPDGPRLRLGRAALAYVQGLRAPAALVLHRADALPTAWTRRDVHRRAGWEARLAPQLVELAEGRLCVLLGTNAFHNRLGAAIRAVGGRTFCPLIGMSPAQAAAWIAYQMSPERAARVQAEVRAMEMDRRRAELYLARALKMSEPTIEETAAGDLQIDLGDDEAVKFATLPKEVLEAVRQATPPMPRVRK